MTVIYQEGDFAIVVSSVLVFSVASLSIVFNPTAAELLEVVVARVTRHHPRASEATGFADEVAFVVKPGITVGTEPKLEQVTLFVALFLGEVHKGDVRDVVGIVRCRRWVLK